MTARDRQKSYADVRRKPFEFNVGDKVLLNVSPWKRVVRLGKKGKLSPRFVGPFEVLERIGIVAYRLRLPEEMQRIHDESLAMPLKDVKINENLKFVERPIKIEDSKTKKLKRKTLKTVKVKWDSRRGPEYTWELESEMNKKYPHLFE